MSNKPTPRTIFHTTKSSDTRTVVEAVADNKHLQEGDRIELNVNNRYSETWRVGRKGNPHGRMVQER